MILTATAEVVILLGFAALIRMPLDLSHVAGFIAVVGTGVDDLIIIADEVMDEGEVSSQRVFESRFRKAFWIIGAAAATTIIALSPLAVLSLGDLRGFAIITILGVLIGVLITRNRPTSRSLQACESELVWLVADSLVGESGEFMGGLTLHG